MNLFLAVIIDIQETLKKRLDLNDISFNKTFLSG